jgi:transposase-like protein
VKEVIPCQKGRYEEMGEHQTRRKYSKQFKIDAVELSLRSSKTVIETAGPWNPF